MKLNLEFVNPSIHESMIGIMIDPNAIAVFQDDGNREEEIFLIRIGLIILNINILI